MPENVYPPLRLVREDDPPRSEQALKLAPESVPLQRVDEAQGELNALKRELAVLRRRDEALKFHMHRLDEELKLAARLQQDFLPKSLPQVGPVRFHTLFRPAGYVSGDLYDVMRLDENHVGFYIADAVGHGMPAALLTMFLKNALVTKEIGENQYRLLSPAQTMAKLNASLVDQKLSQPSFATALYGMIDTSTLSVTFCRGGHPSPILLRADGTIEPLEADGALLGIFPNETFSESTLQMQAGDRLFVFTDGAEIAFTDEPTMDARHWQQELLARASLPTETLMAEVAARIDARQDTPRDDTTIVVVEVQ